MNFPGQCYSLDQQCKYLYGAQSIYCNGVSAYFENKESFVIKIWIFSLI